MSGRLEGKRALITAAGQGIGRATAIAMSKAGAQVFATDVNAKALESLRQDLSSHSETFVLDVRNQESVTSGVAHAAPDILFNLCWLCTFWHNT